MPNPTSIAGCELWFDAADTTTITKAGGLVSQWNDKSGNVNNVSQATGANQPTETTLNALNALVFNGTSDFLANAAATGLPQGVGTFSAFAVAITTSFAGGSETAVSWGSAALFAQFGGYTAGTGWSFNTAVTSGYDATAPTTSVHGYSGVYAGGTISPGYTQWIDGNAETLTFVNPTTAPTASGAALAIGQYVGGGNFFPGTIAEVIFYNSALSTTNRQTLEGYLAWKWGFQANLPVSHPFFSAPPPGWLGGSTAIGNQASPGGATGNGAQSTGAVGNGPSATAIGNG
jgi:hypothetical protein